MSEPRTYRLSSLFGGVLLLVFTAMTAAYGYGRLTDRVAQNEDKITILELRIERALARLELKIDRILYNAGDTKWKR